MTRWMANAHYIAQIQAAAPDLAGMWDGSTFALSSPTSPPPLAGPVPAGIYRSLDQLQHDCAANLIHPAYGWLLIDQEADSPGWTGTPLAEQQDPLRYVREACQFAHRYGPWRIIAAPARDLAGTAVVKPALPGEADTDWYLRVNMAGTAGKYADAVSVQSQAETADLAAYSNMVTAAAGQVRSANPYAIVLAGISARSDFTAGQMAAAARLAVPPAKGFWLNVPGDDVAKAVDFLRLML